MGTAEVRRDIKPGVYADIPNEAYHAGPGVSKSGLWEILTKSPMHYAFAPREETNHFDLGNAGHIAVLEPETFEARVYRGPEDRRGNKWKDAQEYCQIDGKVLLTSGDYDKALMIRDAIHADALLNSVIQSSAARVENSAFWTDEGTSTLCRCRPDLWRPDMGLVIDLKTTTNASADKFSRSVLDYGYHAQEAFYSEGMAASGNAIEGFLFLAVEKKDPFAFAIYELPPSIVADGAAKMRRALGIYAECERTDTWPGYSSGVTELTFKKWAYSETEAPEALDMEISE